MPWKVIAWILVGVVCVGCEESASEVTVTVEEQTAPANTTPGTIVESHAVESAVRSGPAEPPKRGWMQAVIVPEAPDLDGVGQEGVWAKCPPLPLGPCTNQGKGPLDTHARVLFDNTHVYLSFFCAEPMTGQIKQDVSQRDGDVWGDDSVEVFITGDIREGMQHFAVNPRGTLYDARDRNQSWNSEAKVKTAVQDGKSWTATLAIPLKDLQAYVGEGQTWVVNLYRTRPARGDAGMQEYAWSIMGGTDYHQVLDFGRIIDVTVPCRNDGVTRQATAPPPPPSYDKPETIGSIEVYHRFGDHIIEETDDGIGKTFPLRIRGSEGLKVAFLARSGGKIDTVPINMADERANDNTTSKSYRTIETQWTPVVYYCDRFRYNASVESTVARETSYTNLRFHGGSEEGNGKLELRNVVVYRGEDTTPPDAPEDLAASTENGTVSLQWKGSKDNAGVAMYIIDRRVGDGEFLKVAESFDPAWADTSPQAGKATYRVAAVDFQENISDWSEPVSIAVPDEGIQAEECTDRLVKDRAVYAENIRSIHEAGEGKVRKGTVLLFGDSLTYATSYRTATEGALGRYRVESRGYPAKKTSFGRQRIEQDLDAVKPEYCLILLGTNNSKSDKAIQAAMEDIEAMAQSCIERGIVPVFGTIPPRGFKDPASQPEARYNAALVETCMKQKLPVAYIFEDFQEYPDRKYLLAGDGVHWHGKGFDMAGQAWAKTMEPVAFVILDGPTD